MVRIKQKKESRLASEGSLLVHGHRFVTASCAHTSRSGAATASRILAATASLRPSTSAASGETLKAVAVDGTAGSDAGVASNRTQNTAGGPATDDDRELRSSGSSAPIRPTASWRSPIAEARLIDNHANGEKKNVLEFASCGGLDFTVVPGHVDGVPWSRCLCHTLDFEAVLKAALAANEVGSDRPLRALVRMLHCNKWHMGSPEQGGAPLRRLRGLPRGLRPKHPY